jgi:hypothetical protein
VPLIGRVKNALKCPRLRRSARRVFIVELNGGPKVIPAFLLDARFGQRQVQAFNPIDSAST